MTGRPTEMDRLQLALAELEAVVNGGGEDAAGTDAEVRLAAEAVVEAWFVVSEWYCKSDGVGAQVSPCSPENPIHASPCGRLITGEAFFVE